MTKFAALLVCTFTLPALCLYFALQRLALLIKIMVMFQLCAGVTFILVHRYVDGAVNVIGALMGMMTVALEEDEGFSLQGMLCYIAYTCVFMFWSMVRAVFYFAGKEAPQYALHGWESVAYEVAIIADVVIYTVLTVLCYLLIQVRSLSLPFRAYISSNPDVTRLSQYPCFLKRHRPDP